MPPAPSLDPVATVALADWARDRLAASDHAAQARRLGAVVSGPGVVEFGIWAPMASDGGRVELEIFVPPPDLGLPAVDTVQMSVHRFPLHRVGETAWGVVAGLPVGDRDRLGACYRFVVEERDGSWRELNDPMGMSYPFGAFAPAEVVDLDGDRPDAEYFTRLVTADGTGRQGPPTNILQVHVRSATEEGTLAALARRISEASSRVAAGRHQTGDLLWMGYDSIELLPIEPLIGYEGDDGYWVEHERTSDTVTVTVGRPDMHNWGYDIPICGSGTVTPTILETGRPHELFDFVATLHTLPTGPIRVIFDVVYGHADNQALGLMADEWFTGPDMYGQHLDYRHPMVRAQLLEMQRRKADFGADGLRVDGAQDFTYWDAENELLVRDDDFMVEMSEVVQEVAGVAYRPWMIFEDGRPWPRDDWELASTYRAVTERQPHAFQWGPLTFAHNTPFLFTFWVSKWWRLREVADVGSHWISGCANHDTLRRGAQVDPRQRINTFLGDSLPEVIRRAYDHPAATMLFHGFLPGVPMDFLQAIARLPWSFVRTTDRRYALKVWGEEARFLDWRVPPEAYADPAHFERLKSRGFERYGDLVDFMAVLEGAVSAHGDAVEPVLATLRSAPITDIVDLEFDALVDTARSWMFDLHDYSSLTRARLDELDPTMVEFDHRARRFRRDRPWLIDDLTSEDRFDYRHPTAGAVVFHGVRTSPDGAEQVLFVANMEGQPVTVVPTELVGVDAEGWELGLAAPGIEPGPVDRPITLGDATAIIWVRAVPDPRGA